MTSYFFDTSALVKRYHVEAGTPWIRSICDPRIHPPVYISQLAHVECIAALRRAGRTAALHPSFVDSQVSTFQRHLALSDPGRRQPVYELIPLSSPALRLAATLCNRYWDVAPHPLRSLDALQLASALVARTLTKDELLFVTADTRLATVAALEGFSVINPAAPPPR